MTIKTLTLNLLRQIFKFKPFELLLVKFTEGKEFGTFFTLLPPNHYQYPKKTYRQVSRNVVNYHLDISDVVDWYIYFGFKEISREKLFSLIKKNDVVIDIGANVGNVSLSFSNLVGDKGKVFSFESDRTNYQRFRKNIELNNYTNIEAINLGLGNKNDIFSIIVHDDHNRGMNRLIEKSEGNIGELCEVILLNDFYVEKNISKINLIKIDVEGFEKKVLEGADQILNTQKPILFVELDDNNLREQESSAADLILYLEKFGYRVVHSETEKQCLSSMDFTNCHFDIIAYPKMQVSAQKIT